jgi:hypothetical protein
MLQSVTNSSVSSYVIINSLHLDQRAAQSRILPKTINIFASLIL